MQWDLFCRVVDNFGDVGVGWRLAADLAARGESVCLRLDDRGALAWLAPRGAPGVTVTGWDDAADARAPADVVVETFGCGLPDRYVDAMSARPPVWINVEYLSAESYVERSHGLPSPRRHGPGAGLTQWYFYPGFTPATGGLLREADLPERQHEFVRAAWLQALGREAAPQPGERIASLFCYRNERLPQLLDALAPEPTLLLVAAGLPAQQVQALLGPRLERGALRAVVLPQLTQLDYDHLLWAADLNFVRGEDSFVRAQWGAAPFVWQAYPQADGVHSAKVEAFLALFLQAAPAALAADVRRLFAAWNGVAEWPAALPAPQPWRALCAAWRDRLLTHVDLSSQLRAFAVERR